MIRVVGIDIGQQFSNFAFVPKARRRRHHTHARQLNKNRSGVYRLASG
jgi:hypothetical protein